MSKTAEKNFKGSFLNLLVTNTLHYSRKQNKTGFFFNMFVIWSLEVSFLIGKLIPHLLIFILIPSKSSYSIWFYSCMHYVKQFYICLERYSPQPSKQEEINIRLDPITRYFPLSSPTRSKLSFEKQSKRDWTNR